MNSLVRHVWLAVGVCTFAALIAMLGGRANAQVVTNKQVTVVENTGNNVVNVLANDYSPSGFQLNLTGVGAAAHGSVSLSDMKTWALYTPYAGYTGPDSFTYTVSDGNGGTATATASVTVVAQPPAPAVIQASAPMVSPSAALTYYGSATTRTADPAWAPASPEIAALARSLGAGRSSISQAQYAQNVYDYVRNNVATEFRFGLGKGARGALIDLSGTPFDQAELMMKLLRLGGVSATYQLGTIILNAQQFGQWTGLVSSSNLNQSTQTFTVSAQTACQFLADGGIPAIVNNVVDNGTTSYCGSQVSGNLSTVTLLHVWVQTSANSYLFDPSYKQNILKTGVDLAAALGCGNQLAPTCAAQVQSAALTGASTGNLGSTSIPYVQNINESAVSNKLTSYAESLQATIMGGDQYSLLQDVISGRTPDPSYSPIATTSLPYSTGSSTTWTGDIPDQYRTKVTYQFCGQTLSFMGDNLAGRRLRRWVTQAPASGVSWIQNMAPVIYSTYIDDTDLFDCTTPYGAMTASPLTVLSTAPPYAAFNGTYGVNTYSANTPGDVGPDTALSLIVQIGESSDSSVKFMSDLQEADPSPFRGVSTASQAATQTCNTAGGVWNFCRLDSEPTTSQRLLAEQSQAITVTAGVSQAAIRHHSRIGFLTGVGVATYDYYFSVQSLASVQSLVGDAPNVDVELYSHISSMLEGSISQQQNNSWEPESGTTSFILSNRNGFQILDVTPANMTTAVPLLVNYFGRTTSLQALAAAGYESIIPLRGDMPCMLGSGCPGSGWLSPLAPDYEVQNGSVAFLLDETFKGGGLVQGVDPIVSALKPTKQATESRLSEVQGLSYNGSSGAISLSPKPDIVTGDSPFPKGLPFERFYNSGVGVREQLDEDAASGNHITSYSGPDQESAARLGAGWGHNYQITAQISSNSTIATGQYRAIDAAGLIAGSYVNYQLLRRPSFTTRVSAIFADYWLSKQLLWNAVHVKIGSKAMDFTKLPDGSYNPPQGQSAQLVQTGTLPPYVDPGSGLWPMYDFSGIGFTLTEGDGSVISFDNSRMNWIPVGTVSFGFGAPQFKANSWKFPDGTNVTLTYTAQQVNVVTGEGTQKNNTSYVLSKVSNNLGRSLTFNTSPTRPGSTEVGIFGWIINSVADESGRTVSYALSNCPNFYANYGAGTLLASASLACNTLSVTEPNSAVWTYGYAPGSDSPDPSIITRPAYHLRRWYTPTNASTAYEVLAYDPLYRAATVTDILGHQTSYYAGGIEGTEVWKRSDVVTPLSETSTRVLNFYDETTQITDPIGRVTTYAYDNGRRKIRETYPAGNFVTYDVYDARSNLLQKTRNPSPGSPLKPITTYVTYGVGADASTASSPSTLVNCSTWATCNKPASETDGRGATTKYGWNSTTGALTQILKPTDLNGNPPETDFGYTPYTASDGSTFVLPTSKTDVISMSNGTVTKSLVTTFAYNTANKYVLQTVTVDPSGANLITKFLFDSFGDPTSVTDPNLNVTNYNWDTVRRLALTVEPAAPAVVNGVTQSVSLATQYLYDLDNELTETDHGTWTSSGGFSALEKATFAYDAFGNKIQATTLTAVGQSAPATLTEYSYDNDNRPLCTAVRMSPPAYGSAYVNACTLSNSSDRISEIAYDAAGQKQTEFRGVGSGSGGPGTGWEQVYASYTYTPNGKVLTVTDASWSNNLTRQQPGNQTCYLYDGFDRLVRTQYPMAASANKGQCDPSNIEYVGKLDSTGQNYSDGYDANDNRLFWTKRDGVTTISTCYDALNRPVAKYLRQTQNSTIISVLCTAGQALPALTGSDVATTYDLMDKPLSELFVSGQGVSYGYDTAERLTSETTSNAIKSWTMKYTLDANGNAKQVIWLDGTPTSGFYAGYVYDALNRVTAVNENGATTGAGVLASYSYDALGRRSGITRGNGTTTGFGYDPADRISSLAQAFPASPGYNETWGFGYNPASQLINRTWTNTAYSWTNRPTTPAPATYDGLNRDASIATISDGYDKNGNLTDDGTRHFGYDLENRLLCVAASASACTPSGVTSGGTPTATLSYDPTGRLEQYVTTGANGATRYFLYRADKLSAEYDASGTLVRRYVYGPGTDEPLVWYDYPPSGGPVRNWLHVDRQGSVIATSNDSGTVAQTYAYGPYGEPQAWGGSRFAYTGQIQLPELQIYHYKARVYDPSCGCFLQTDPVGYKSDLDLYAYVHDDPLDLTDPTGEKCATGTHDNGYGCVEPATKEDRQKQDKFAKDLKKVEAQTNKEMAIGGGALIATGVTAGAGAAIIDGAAGGAVVAEAGADAAADGAGAEAGAARGAAQGAEDAEGAGARGARNACCFVAGTLVSTKEGLRPIERIQVGDLVLSRDAISGRTAFKPVAKLIRRHDRQIYVVTIEAPSPDGSQHQTAFRTTDDHPWRTSGKKWVQTIDLRAGMSLERAEGLPGRVLGVLKTGYTAPTFNLEIADFHTYFVGEDRVWVHNACKPPQDGGGKPPRTGGRRAQGTNCPNCGTSTQPNGSKFDWKWCADCFFKKWTFWPWDQ